MADLPVLIYDGDCGFCTRSARLIERLPLRTRLAPWQESDLAALDVTEERARQEVLWVDEAQRVFGGGRAIGELLKHCRGPLRYAGLVLAAPIVRSVADRVYHLVSNNRDHLPGETPACEQPPDQRPGARRNG